MPTVSVIVPTYGHENYILRTLDSVFEQSYRDFEIIVVNDGSPDETSEVLRPLVEARRIRYFEQMNQGVSAARIFGISQAQGEYIALLDDDDLWPENKLKWQVEEILSDSELIAVCGSATFMGADESRSERDDTDESHELKLEEFFEGNQIYSPGQVLFKKSVGERGIVLDPSIWGADDLDFWMQMAKGGKFLWRERTALYYRVHETNASRKRLKMLHNLNGVLDKHASGLGEERKRYCLKAGYRWLYSYMGKAIVWDARFCLITKSPRIFRGFTEISSLMRVFAKPCLKDFKLCNDLLKELWIAFGKTTLATIWELIFLRKKASNG